MRRTAAAPGLPGRIPSPTRHEPAGFGISPAANLGYRLLGLSAIFGLGLGLYWIAALSLTGGTLGPTGFYAPFLFLLLVVLPVEVRRVVRGRRYDEA